MLLQFREIPTMKARRSSQEIARSTETTKKRSDTLKDGEDEINQPIKNIKGSLDQNHE